MLTMMYEHEELYQANKARSKENRNNFRKKFCIKRNFDILIKISFYK